MDEFRNGKEEARRRTPRASHKTTTLLATRFALVLGALNVIFISGAEATGQTSTEYLANSPTLVLRKQPQWDAPISGKLMRGEPVRVLNHGEVWATVQYKNQEMFVPFALLSESSPWVVEQRELSSTKVAAHFRKKRFKSRKEIRDTLKNVQKKGTLENESEVIDDPELIAQLSGAGELETADAGIFNPMDDGPTETADQGPTTAAERTPGKDVPSSNEDASAELAARDPAKAKGDVPQAFGPAVKALEPMKFDLKSIRRMDKYKISDKDLRRFRAQGKLAE